MLSALKVGGLTAMLLCACGIALAADLPAGAVAVGTITVPVEQYDDCGSGRYSGAYWPVRVTRDSTGQYSFAVEWSFIPYPENVNEGTLVIPQGNVIWRFPNQTNLFAVIDLGPTFAESSSTWSGAGFSYNSTTGTLTFSGTVNYVGNKGHSCAVTISEIASVVPAGL